MSKAQMMKELGLKRDAQMRHAVERAQERYHIRLVSTEYFELVRAVENEECEILGEQIDERKLAVRVFFADQWLTAIYDKSTQRISTFLPPNAMQADGVILVDELREGGELVIEHPVVAKATQEVEAQLEDMDQPKESRKQLQRKLEEARKQNTLLQDEVNRLKILSGAHAKALEDMAQARKFTRWTKHFICTYVKPLLSNGHFLEAASLLDGLVGLHRTSDLETDENKLLERVYTRAKEQREHWEFVFSRLSAHDDKVR